MTNWSMCPYCHREYDGGQFAKCPNCKLAEKAASSSTKSGNAGGLIAVLVVLLLVGCALSQCASCTSGDPGSAPIDTSAPSSEPQGDAVSPEPESDAPPTLSDDELAAKAEAALASAGESNAIHGVLGIGSGHVAVTLNLTIDAMGGRVLAEDRAKAVANIIFARVPEVTKVLVLDGNRDAIGQYGRK